MAPFYGDIATKSSGEKALTGSGFASLYVKTNLKSEESKHSHL
jgi:hypothetical protein